MHIKLNNGVPEKYTIGQLRKDNPNVSFPRIVPEEILAEYGVYPAVTPERPTIDPRTQKATQATVPTQVNGVWTYTWTVEDRTAAEIALLDESMAINVRGKRDTLLTESDWTQVADAPVDQAAWATYRQALRDIPDQEGFPNTMDWPVEP